MAKGIREAMWERHRYKRSCSPLQRAGCCVLQLMGWLIPAATGFRANPAQIRSVSHCDLQIVSADIPGCHCHRTPAQGRSSHLGGLGRALCSMAHPGSSVEALLSLELPSIVFIQARSTGFGPAALWEGLLCQRWTWFLLCILLTGFCANAAQWHSAPRFAFESAVLSCQHLENVAV